MNLVRPSGKLTAKYHLLPDPLLCADPSLGCHGCSSCGGEVEEPWGPRYHWDPCTVALGKAHPLLRLSPMYETRQGVIQADSHP